MIDRTRDKESGKFVQKSEQKRKVRSIRLTDNTYDYLREKAEQNNQTIADLIEKIVEDKLLEDNQDNNVIEDLKQRSIDVVFDEEFRAKDRGLIKRVFAKLFDIDKAFYPKNNPSITR